MAAEKQTQIRLRYSNGKFIASLKKPENIREILEEGGIEAFENFKPVEISEADTFLLFPEIVSSREKILGSERSVFEINKETGVTRGNIKGETIEKINRVEEYADTNGTYVAKNPGSAVEFTVFKSENGASPIAKNDTVLFGIKISEIGAVTEVLVGSYQLLYTQPGTYTTDFPNMDTTGTGLQISFDVTAPKIEGFGGNMVSNIQILNAGSGYTDTDTMQKFPWVNSVGEYIVKEELTDGTWSIDEEDLEEGFYYTFQFSEMPQIQADVRDIASYFAITRRVGNRFQLIPQSKAIRVPSQSLIKDPMRVPSRVILTNPDTMVYSQTEYAVIPETTKDSEIAGAEEGLAAFQFEATAKSISMSNEELQKNALFDPDVRVPLEYAAGAIAIDIKQDLESLIKFTENVIFYLPKNIVLNSTLEQKPIEEYPLK